MKIVNILALLTIVGSRKREAAAVRVEWGSPGDQLISEKLAENLASVEQIPVDKLPDEPDAPVIPLLTKPKVHAAVLAKIAEDDPQGMYADEDDQTMAQVQQMLEDIVEQAQVQDHVENERPIIGILSHDIISRFSRQDEYAGYKTFIPDSYVKFVEASGARAMPLIYKHHTDEEIVEYMDKINGLILPGGAGDNEYEEWEENIFRMALAKNDAGIRFPIVGICLGFQHMTKYVAGKTYLRRRPLKQTLRPLLFQDYDISTSRLFGDPNLDIDSYKNSEVFFHQHNYGISPSAWERSPELKKMFRILAIDFDTNGEEFVNIYEGIHYPIYAYQFHPEKATGAMSKFNNFSHVNNAIQLNRYFGDFLVQESRQNNQEFPSYEDELKELITNYDLHETDTYYGGIFTFD